MLLTKKFGINALRGILVVQIQDEISKTDEEIGASICTNERRGRAMYVGYDVDLHHRSRMPRDQLPRAARIAYRDAQRSCIGLAREF